MGGIKWRAGSSPEDLGRKFKRASVEVKKKAEGVMRSHALIIKKQSQLNAPVDTHNLEKSHHIRKRRLKSGISYRVFVEGGNRVNIYAQIMHDGHYNLGPKSQKKQAANPDNIVGRQYLKRAIDDDKEALLKDLDKALSEGFNK